MQIDDVVRPKIGDDYTCTNWHLARRPHKQSPTKFGKINNRTDCVPDSKATMRRH